MSHKPRSEVSTQRLVYFLESPTECNSAMAEFPAPIPGLPFSCITGMRGDTLVPAAVKSSGGPHGRLAWQTQVWRPPPRRQPLGQPIYFPQEVLLKSSPGRVHRRGGAGSKCPKGFPPDPGNQ